MPNAAGKTVFEDVVALLASKPNPMDLGRSMDVITAGMTDLSERLKNLEFESLKNSHAATMSSDRVAATEERQRVLEGDRDAYRKRLDAVEHAPADATKRLDDMHKRVSAVEGAVGSTGFKDAKAAPKTVAPLTSAPPLTTAQPLMVT